VVLTGKIKKSHFQEVILAVDNTYKALTLALLKIIDYREKVSITTQKSRRNFAKKFSLTSTKKKRLN